MMGIGCCSHNNPYIYAVAKYEESEIVVIKLDFVHSIQSSE